MKTSRNNEILEATVAELHREWKVGQWDEDYSFEEYFKIMTEHNHVKIADPSENTTSSEE